MSIFSQLRERFVSFGLNNRMTKTLYICRKTVVVQFSNKASDEQKGKYHIAVCLKKVLCTFPACVYLLLMLHRLLF